jgi:hypothetical protein
VVSRYRDIPRPEERSNLALLDLVYREDYSPSKRRSVCREATDLPYRKRRAPAGRGAGEEVDDRSLPKEGRVTTIRRRDY